jgi:hypothetical protein
MSTFVVYNKNIPLNDTTILNPAGGVYEKSKG